MAGNPPDGAVAVTDVIQEVLKFGWTSQNPNWIAWMQANPQYQSFPYDLDFNNAITVSDISISVSQFGRSCPT